MKFGSTVSPFVKQRHACASPITVRELNGGVVQESQSQGKEYEWLVLLAVAVRTDHQGNEILGHARQLEL